MKARPVQATMEEASPAVGSRRREPSAAEGAGGDSGAGEAEANVSLRRRPSSRSITRGASRPFPGTNSEWTRKETVASSPREANRQVRRARRTVSDHGASPFVTWISVT